MSKISREAESFVCLWLEDRGWAIEARNFRTRRSEIDIVAKKEDVLSFVEVKFASDSSATVTLDKIDSAKQARLVHAAMVYLSTKPPSGQIRFDVAIVRGTSMSFRMETYLEDAFRPDIM
ncbi:MAG: YraN family protein [Candidatus Aegiribacteria sp.]|nr:YraN family protein [Candidatus Aegiribacteria sp.]